MNVGDVPRLADAFPEAAVLGAALRAAGLTVAVAESCTGGLLGAALTAIPGASEYFVGGVVAYADAVKRDALGVGQAILDAEGAVSGAVARAMAEGARHQLGTDIGLSITGVAGPAGGGDSKPAGLTWVGCAGPGAPVVAVRSVADSGREGNRAEAVRLALRLCLTSVSAIENLTP